jgi:hypothetical protein
MPPKHYNASHRKTLILALGGLLLAGCGGGGGSAKPPATPTLHMTVQSIKTFAFTWDAVDGATHYKLLENADGSSGFSPISGAGNLTATGYDHVVPLHKRVNASYVLQACNDGGCTDSAPVAVTGNLAQAIGYFKASNTESGDVFGGAIALSADGATLAVGAPQESSAATGVNGNQLDNSQSASGAVYVFSHKDGLWSQQAYLKASNSRWGEYFGDVLALSSDGNTLAIAVPYEDSAATGINGDATDNSAPNSGAVFVFARAGATWFQQAYVKASNTQADDTFGISLALSGDGNTLAVGAAGEDGPTNAVSNSGAVYLYTRTAGAWSGHSLLRAPDPDAEDGFGRAVALSGDGGTLAVGSSGEDGSATGIDGVQDEGASNSGAVYVYSLTGAGWSQQAYVKASNSEAGDGFGGRVALSGNGNTLAVIAGGEDSGAAGVDGDQTDNSLETSGALYLFQREGATWSQAAYIKASKPNTHDEFGHALALSADGLTVAVGAYWEDSNATGINGDQSDASAIASGAAYVFTRAGGAWRQQAYVKAPNTQASDNFGSALALSGDGGILAIGAFAEDSSATGVGGDGTNNWQANSGAAYLY